MSASPNESAAGQLRSGDCQPCHVTCVELPNDALFMHGAAFAFPLRAAARSAKNRTVVAAESVNGFGVLAAAPERCFKVSEPFPSDQTWIA